MAQVYELSARYDSRLSFYGKAQVIDTPKKLRLQSYDTIVATWDKAKKTLTIHPNRYYAPKGHYGCTTSRHIREFARQLDLCLDKVNVGTYQG